MTEWINEHSYRWNRLPDHLDVSKEMPPAQHLQYCLTHLCFKAYFRCGCVLARKKTANSMRSIMAFSSILSFGPVIRFLQACPDPRSCLSPNSPFVTKAESSPAILYYRTTTFKYFVFFFSQIAGFPCASPILFFLLSLYTPPPPATPSVYRKFTLPVSTKSIWASRGEET